MFFSHATSTAFAISALVGLLSLCSVLRQYLHYTGKFSDVYNLYQAYEFIIVVCAYVITSFPVTRIIVFDRIEIFAIMTKMSTLPSRRVIVYAHDTLHQFIIELDHLNVTPRVFALFTSFLMSVDTRSHQSWKLVKGIAATLSQSI